MNLTCGGRPAPTDGATCVSNNPTPVARRFFLTKVVARVVSFCVEQGIRRRVLNTFFPTDVATTLRALLLQYTRLPISVDPIFPAPFLKSILLSPPPLPPPSFPLFLSLPPSTFLSYLRYVLSGLASPLHLFPPLPLRRALRFLLPPVPPSSDRL